MEAGKAAPISPVWAYASVSSIYPQNKLGRPGTQQIFTVFLEFAELLDSLFGPFH